MRGSHKNGSQIFDRFYSVKITRKKTSSVEKNCKGNTNLGQTRYLKLDKSRINY